VRTVVRGFIYTERRQTRVLSTTVLVVVVSSTMKAAPRPVITCRAWENRTSAAASMAATVTLSAGSTTSSCVAPTATSRHRLSLILRQVFFNVLGKVHEIIESRRLECRIEEGDMRGMISRGIPHGSHKRCNGGGDSYVRHVSG
jgi:hypothetical protein